MLGATRGWDGTQTPWPAGFIPVHAGCWEQPMLSQPYRPWGLGEEPCKATHGSGSHTGGSALPAPELTVSAYCRVSPVTLGPPGPKCPEGCHLVSNHLGLQTAAQHFSRPRGGTWLSSSRWFADGFLPWHGCWAAPSSRGPDPALMRHLLCHPHITCRVPAPGASSPFRHPVSSLLLDASVPGPHQGLHPALSSAHLASLFFSLDLDSTACHHHPDLGPGAPSTADPSPARSRCLPALVLHGRRKPPNRWLIFLNS